MSASELMKSLERDSVKRLKWLVIRETGISPVSLAARLLGTRKALEIACQLVLDRRVADTQNADGGNPEFDMAKFCAMRGSGV